MRALASPDCIGIGSFNVIIEVRAFVYVYTGLVEAHLLQIAVSRVA
jgi:hypothetical protein